MAQDDFLQFQERVKQAESRGRRFDSSGKLLTSPKGAQGEMQVMPGTQVDPGFGVVPAKDASADEIARVGRDYLAAMEKRYGDRSLAAIAYNMGPGATDKWIAKGSDFSKLPAETQAYVQAVMGGVPSATAQVSASAPSPKATPAADMGVGYQAALALSFLDDKDNEDDDEKAVAKLDEEEDTQAAKMLAEYKPYNALAELDLSSTAPKQFQKGGDVDKDRPMTEGEFEAMMNPESSMLEKASKLVQGGARQLLDSAFPIRRVVRAGAEPTLEAVHEKYVLQDPETVYQNRDITSKGSATAHFHIKNALRKSLGLEPLPSNAVVELPPLETNSFPVPNEGIPPPFGYGKAVRRADGSPESGEVTGINKLVDFVAQRLDPGMFPTSARTLLETVQGAKTPITESNFSPEEHDIMRQLAVLKGGQKGNIDYGDYVKLAEQMKKTGKVPVSVTPGLLSMSDPLGNVQTTLGRFSYKTDPKGNLQVVDRYDFNPIYDQGAMQEAQTGDYGALNPYGLVRNYAGQKIPPGKGREVLINLGPVKRAGGSPETGEELEPMEQRSSQGGYGNTVPPTRSAQQLQAYMESMNPTVQVNERPMEPGLLGYVQSDKILRNMGAPNVLHINTEQSPGNAEITKLHELEHALDVRGGDIKGRPDVRYSDNTMRAYYLMDNNWGPISQTVQNMVNNKEKLEKFFGRPIESGYFHPESLKNLLAKGNETALFKEQLATLSALEQVTGKSLTRDSEMRQLFPNTRMMAVYDALTGPRQTRLDARDLPPHTPQPSYTYETNPAMRFIKQHLGPKQEYGIPVKRAGGSPETGEVGPYIGNPNIARQGQAARRLAAMRDVNTLPDPKTYAAVSGFLGVPPDEQGFSVMHPNAAGIRQAGEAGFYGGIGAQLAPVVGPAAKMLGKVVGSGINERLLSGQSLTPGFNTPAPVNFAVRPEQGGFFLHSQRSGLDEVDSFLRHFAGVQKESRDPLDQWVYKRYSSYMRGPMATEADPFVKGADAGRHFHFMDENRAVFQPQYADSVPYVRRTQGLPESGFAKTAAGQDVERAIDASISPIEVGDVGELNLSPKMKELAQRDRSAPVYEVLAEEMDNVLKPEELRMSLRAMMTDPNIPDAYKITPEQLQKMTLLDASEKAGQFERYMTEKEGVAMMRNARGVPVYKDYDDGYRWMAPADTAEDEVSKQYVLSTGRNAHWCTKEEKSCASYGSGNSHLFILANTKNGKPLVQVNYDTVVPEVEDWLRTMPWEQKKELLSKHMIYQMENLPEFKQWQRANSQEHIQEIKGRYNETDLEGDALEKTRDLIRSKDWDKVNDIEHAQLYDTRDLYPDDVVENYIKPNFGTRFLTPEELQQMPKPTSFAKGGMVERRMNDNRKYL